MLNYEVFNKETQPTESEIKDFVGTKLFADLDNHLRSGHNITPKFSYSGCSMDNNIWKGWNIKYQKKGKSLCTIYPQQGYFMALVPGKSFEVRNKENLNEVKFAIEDRNEEISLMARKKNKKTIQSTSRVGGVGFFVCVFRVNLTSRLLVSARR